MNEIWRLILESKIFSWPESAIEAVIICLVPDHLYNYPPRQQHLQASELSETLLIGLFHLFPASDWLIRALRTPLVAYDGWRMVTGDRWGFCIFITPLLHVITSCQQIRGSVILLRSVSLQLPYCTQSQILISNLTHGGSQDNKTFTVVWDDILVLIVPNLVAPESKPSLECLIRHTDIHIGISINKN